MLQSESQTIVGQNNFQLSVESNSGLLWFCFTSFCDWSRNSPHFLDQSDSKLKPIATWPLAFFRAPGSLLVFTRSSLWLLMIFSFLCRIGCRTCFGFSFTTFNRKALYHMSNLIWNQKYHHFLICLSLYCNLIAFFKKSLEMWFFGVLIQLSHRLGKDAI